MRARRWAGGRLEREPDLRRAVLEGLRRGWSAEQVAGRLALERGHKVISSRHLRFIYAQIRRTTDGSWRRYLPRAESKRGLRAKQGGSPASFIEGRVSLANRPLEVADRIVPGHWEADLMMFSKYGQPCWPCMSALLACCSASALPASSRPVSHAISCACSRPCQSGCARPSPSTTAPSSRRTCPYIASRSKPSSVILTRPGRKAVSRTPSAGCAASSLAKRIS